MPLFLFLFRRYYRDAKFLRDKAAMNSIACTSGFFVGDFDYGGIDVWGSLARRVTEADMLDYVKPVFLVFVVVIAAGAMGGFMAANRGRSVAAWCLLCALFPPLLLVLHYVKPRN